MDLHKKKYKKIEMYDELYIIDRIFNKSKMELDVEDLEYLQELKMKHGSCLEENPRYLQEIYYKILNKYKVLRHYCQFTIKNISDIINIQNYQESEKTALKTLEKKDTHENKYQDDGTFFLSFMKFYDDVVRDFNITPKKFYIDFGAK